MRPPKDNSAFTRALPVLPWVVGNLMVLVLIRLDLTLFNNGLVGDNAFWGRDFVNVWTSGHLVLQGQLDRLYDLVAYHSFQDRLFPGIAEHNYSYPPLTLPLMVPFALMPYWLALATWICGTGLLFVHAAAPWWRKATDLSPLLILLTPAALINGWAGHYGFLIAALLIYGWRTLPTRPVLAGICFGLIAIKPHLAILVPLVLLIRRDWLAIGSAAGTVAALAGLSILLFGIAPWHDYLTVTTGVQASMIDADGRFFGLMSTSMVTALLAFGLPQQAALAVYAVIAVAALAMVAHAARHAKLEDTALLAATATFLVLPYAFNYDLTLSAMGAGMLMASAIPGGPEWRIAAFGFMAAQVGMALAALSLPLMPVMLIALAVLQYHVAMRRTGVSSVALLERLRRSQPI